MDKMIVVGNENFDEFIRDEVVDTLKPDIASALGLSADVKVCAGAGDNAAAVGDRNGRRRAVQHFAQHIRYGVFVQPGISGL